MLNGINATTEFKMSGKRHHHLHISSVQTENLIDIKNGL